MSLPNKAMDTATTELCINSESRKKSIKRKFSLRSLRLSLKYRPDILKLVLKMRHCIQKKNSIIKSLKQQLLKSWNTTEPKKSTKTTKVKSLDVNEDKDSLAQSNDVTTTEDKAKEKEQKEPVVQPGDDTTTEYKPKEESNKEKTESSESKEPDSGWNLKNDEEGKSIAEQVKEAAQSALQSSGMVYVESARMYYDYKTGYYYNSELGLYYHTTTGCYYYFNEDKKEFVFHSYPDRSAVAVNPSLEAHERRKIRKQRKAQKTNEEIDNLTKNLSQEEDESSKPKRRKKVEKKKKKQKKPSSEKKEDESAEIKTETESVETDTVSEDKELASDVKKEENGTAELEDGECSETSSDNEKSDDDEKSNDEESVASTATLSDDDAIAKHHPPCMRIIVRETKLPKLKVGSLFLITKDGGTIGREGEHHTILLKDNNVSRNHLDIKYDMYKRIYQVTDLGSKNGTLLNGIQMSESQVASEAMEVVHGSSIQLGETKLMCHIHPGNDTCGHCEPGLIMETQEKVQVAYTRSCNVKKQYELELARLKNKYKPEPLMIEDGSYQDRAKARREAVGSSHHSEKTQTADIDTPIAAENKGFKLLEKMGWSKGEGLGKDSQGETAPIPLVGNEGKVGLGTPGAVAPPPLIPVPRVRNTLGPATMRLVTKSKLLHPPAKAFQPEDDEEFD